MKKVVFVGSGAIGTAIGNVLARKGVDDITLLSIEEEVVESINELRYNLTYFPNVKLSRNLWTRYCRQRTIRYFYHTCDINCNSVDTCYSQP